MRYLSNTMACRKLPYYHWFLHSENFSSPLKVVYRKPLREEKGCWDKYQWDLIHNPESVLFSWLEEEEEGAVVAETYYWTPAGTPIYMPSAATTLIDIVKLNNKTQINGILYSWKEGTSTTYVADIDPINNKFYGYIKSGTSEKFSDVTNLIAGQKIPVNSIMYIGNCTKEDIISQYTIPENIDGNTYYSSGKPVITEFSYTQGEKANTYQISGCTDNTFTGKAKDFKDYCTGKFSNDQTVDIDKTVGQIQLMGDFYNDYEKLVLSTNPYSTWVNTAENLNTFYKALAKYYEEHKNAPLIENTNCTDCPKYPMVGDTYWDEAGRNWVFWEGNIWKDLSGEFCEEDCNNEWKSRIDVQAVHKAYYGEKLRLLENDSWQRSLGINEEFKKNLWRATQFATVHFLKENWTAEQVGDSWWNLLFGNVKSAFYKVQVANGDQTFYASAALDGVFGAVDIFLLESIAKNMVWKFGIKYLIIEGGAKQLSQNVYYTVCKQAVTLRLAYKLSFGTPEAISFFEKQLTKTIEIYDNAAGRYIKFDPVTGEALIGRIATEGENVIVYESYGKIPVTSGLSESQQANYIVEKIGTLITNNVYKEGDEIAGKIIKGVRQGSNGKIAIIGRQMKGHVIDVANALKAEGKQVEIFSDIDQAGKIFNIEGKSYKWEEIVDDFRNLDGKYKTNEKGWILESELPNTLIYKANNQWAQKLVSEGYTVIDFSFPANIYSESVFYDMELSIIFR